MNTGWGEMGKQLSKIGSERAINGTEWHGRGQAAGQSGTGEVKQRDRVARDRSGSGTEWHGRGQAADRSRTAGGKQLE
ncbi:hypothetical protein NDU88_001321 [Pleurodeles waltl]|uniref:Uncharacterized protein n=1 Tax=Pleurodeles waltl TaxID=8319 RepID=A0AAV7ND20_PLEWA|nr:hypothetical protein NDU88_001321 [Pleurodeles waltl]